MVRFPESQKIGGRQVTGVGPSQKGGGIMKTEGRVIITEAKTGESYNPKVEYARVRRWEGVAEPECGVTEILE